ncbi:hypothetical protein ACOMHN_057777 [Nucella lapillus]
MWVNNSRYMPGLTLANVTRGRVRMDIKGSLHITPLTVWDRGLYLCIIDSKEKGHVFLNVTALEVNEYEYYRRWVLYSIPVDFVVFLFLMILKHIHRKRILISSEEAGSPDDDPDDDDDDNNSNTNASNLTVSVLRTSSQCTSVEDVSPSGPESGAG